MRTTACSSGPPRPASRARCCCSAAFGSASAFVLHAVLQARARRKELRLVDANAARPALLDSPELLLCGLIAALVGAMLHSMFDSDLYVVAMLLTFCALFGLAIALARGRSSASSQKGRTVGRELWAIGLAVCLFLFVRSGQIGFARWDEAQIDPAQITNAERAAEAIQSARAAASADPFDAEPHIALGQLLADTPEGEHEFQTATRLAPGGRTFYLLGRQYREEAATENDRLRKAKIVKSALEAFERARAYDPHNLQTLRALAETERQAGDDQNDTGLRQQARFTYQTMAALEHAPFGAIRPMPELIEVDFAYAHVGLAQLAERDGNLDAEEAELNEALRIVRQYWPTRNWLVNLYGRSPAARSAIGDLYVQALTSLIETAGKERKRTDVPGLSDELSRVEADRKADQAKSNPAASPAP